MSSILRALKKLENEPRHVEENPSLDSKFVSLADTEPKRPVSSLFLMVIGGGTICGLVILAGWWLLSEKPQSPPAVTKKISRPTSELAKTSPVSSSNLNKVEDPAVSEKPEKLPVKEPAAPETIERVTGQEPASSGEPAIQTIGREDILPIEQQRPQETLQAQKTSSLKPDEHVSSPAVKTAVASISTPAIPAKRLKVEIPKLKDPDVKLQAVTWSKTPQKRIAVINNRIVREGEMVSGYLIKEINQDDVILSQEGTKWKLMFR